jgi:hypothetical protein
LQTLKDSGIDAATAASSLSAKIRQDFMSRQPAADIKLLKQLLEVTATDWPYDRLELALLETAVDNSDKTTQRHVEKKATKSSEPASTTAPKALSTQLKTDHPADELIDKWPEVINSAKHKAASIYTALKLAEPVYSNGVLILKFEFPLHQKKLMLAKNKVLVADLIEAVTGQKIVVECVVDKATFDKKSTHSKRALSLRGERIQSISNVFGSAEVLESQGNFNG